MLNCSTSGSSTFSKRRAVQQPGHCIPHTSPWKNELLVKQKQLAAKTTTVEQAEERKKGKKKKSFNTLPCLQKNKTLKFVPNICIWMWQSLTK